MSSMWRACEFHVEGLYFHVEGLYLPCGGLVSSMWRACVFHVEGWYMLITLFAYIMLVNKLHII